MTGPKLPDVAKAGVAAALKMPPLSQPIVVRGDELEPERVDWTWPGRIAKGKVLVLDGDPGVGKSTLALDIAARITTGGALPDGEPMSRPMNVVMLSAEDGLADTIIPRFRAAGGIPNRLRCITGIAERDGAEVRQRPFIIPTDLDHLEEIILAAAPVGLVIVDVLMAFLNSRVDSKSDSSIRGALMPLAQLSERTGAPILCLRHLNKSGGTNPLYRGGGSIGIVGAARVGWMVTRDPDDETRCILAISKNNLAPIAPSLVYRVVSNDEYQCGTIEWDGTSKYSAADLLEAHAADEDERYARDDAEGFLEDQLARGPVPATTLLDEARKVGIAEKTLKRAKKRIGVTSERTGGIGSSGAWVWRMTPKKPKGPIKKDGLVSTLSLCARCDEEVARTVTHYATGEELCPACCLDADAS